jgi:predicted pyridoxine 5'-phosphate oxidase superfamily flavin-nucleotide-binding protein
MSNTDIVFSPTTKAIQSARGSRPMFERLAAEGGFRDRVDPRLAFALAEANSAFFVTTSADGQPYAQHRGGPPGFIRVLDETTLGFADFAGNEQYITHGNLADNPKAFLFVMDYARRRRVKIWGRARIVEDDADMIARLMPEGYRAYPQAVILFEIIAWDTNCPQHIPQKFEAADVAKAIAERDAEITRLKAEIARLTSETTGEVL